MPTDFAIVGAGVAGTYVAWRIAEATQNNPKRPSIKVYEHAHREGGRLLTAKMPGMPFRAELGGMRYTADHILLSRLAKKLDLPSDEFKFETKFSFLRGKLYRDGEQPPYEIKGATAPIPFVKRAFVKALAEIELRAPDEKQAAVVTIEEKIRHLRHLRDVVENNRDGLDILNIRFGYSFFSRSEWNVIKQFAWLADQPLFKSGFWNLLHHYLSGPEEFFFVRSALGYQSIFENWNAAEAIPWFLRDFDAKYKRLRGGMDQLPSRLAFDLSHKFQAEIYFRHTVKSVTLVPSREPVLELRFLESPEVVSARAVVLALPKNALDKVELFGFEKQQLDRFGILLNAVTANPLFKLFLGYETAWWGRLGEGSRMSGRAITDLPIRQVYYFGPDDIAQDTEMGMVMASYSDAHFIDFWRPLHRRPLPHEDEIGFFCSLDKNLLGEEELAFLKAFGATERMVNKAHSQIELMHPDLTAAGKIRKPFVALEKEWESGWHSWKPHYKSWEVMSAIKRPFGLAKVFVCGEAFSCDQGWIEGALRSAELVLKELEVQAPSWLEKEDLDYFDEYIGYQKER